VKIAIKVTGAYVVHDLSFKTGSFVAQYNDTIQYIEDLQQSGALIEVHIQVISKSSLQQFGAIKVQESALIIFFMAEEHETDFNIIFSYIFVWYDKV